MSENFSVKNNQNGTQIHFYPGGSLIAQTAIDAGGERIAGEFPITAIAEDAITIETQSGKTVEIALSDLPEKRCFARIPSQIRGDNFSPVLVAPFHLRDENDDTLDELPEGFSPELREAFGEGEFADIGAARNFAELIIDVSNDYEYIQVCNGYSNTVEMVEMTGMRLDDDVRQALVACAVS